MSIQKWKLLSETDVSPSPWLPVLHDEVLLPNGKKVDYFKSNLNDVAMVLPISKQKEVIFVKQYKHGIGEVCIEFPAGRIEKGKTARQAAVSELLEEAGIAVEEKDLIEVGELWTEPSKSTVRVSAFLAVDVEITQDQNLEETEAIEIVNVPLRDLKTFFLKNIHASDTLALLLLAKAQFPDHFV